MKGFEAKGCYYNDPIIGNSMSDMDEEKWERKDSQSSN